MKSLFPFRILGLSPEEAVLPPAVTAEVEPETTLFRTIGWITAGLGALALGVVLGREIRQRYKFNRRTPYDFYTHAGDEQDIEFGVGV